MDPSLINDLLTVVFPREIVDRFDITNIEQPADHQLRITLVEKATPPIDQGACVVSKGFATTKIIYDYPLRDRAVILAIKRRRWRDRTTGKDIHVPLTLTASGTSYTKEFGAFLKGDD